ncbi:hypothetical protein [Kiloniella majae]|uniref:hypothetical protein n=1 Tax=Kiloniella majae TaxID=1938558 RepID=UPI000A279755|nr:hypothetical protein [Kiloniella majae]
MAEGVFSLLSFVVAFILTSFVGGIIFDFLLKIAKGWAGLCGLLVYFVFRCSPQTSKKVGVILAHTINPLSVVLALSLWPVAF